MKCEICNEEIEKGKGRYLTPIGAVCTKCNDGSSMKVNAYHTRFCRDSGSSEYVLLGYPDMVAAGIAS